MCKVAVSPGQARGCSRARARSGSWAGQVTSAERRLGADGRGDTEGWRRRIQISLNQEKRSPGGSPNSCRGILPASLQRFCKVAQPRRRGGRWPRPPRGRRADGWGAGPPRAGSRALERKPKPKPAAPGLRRRGPPRRLLAMASRCAPGRAGRAPPPRRDAASRQGVA